MSEVYINACGDYVERVETDGAATDLRPLVVDAIGTSVRRIGRFIQLALIAAGRCAKQVQVPKDAGVYLGSGRGDLEVTIEVMDALLRDGHAPKPLSFINTVSNAACYYVAQGLALMGRSSFVCNRYFAFESMLQLAALDLNSGEIDIALVGCVDVVVPPLEAHRIRLGLSSATPVGDASHWVCLQNSPTETTLARLIAAEPFCDRDALRRWLESLKIDRNWMLATGQFMEATEAKQWTDELGLAVFDYRTDRPYYDSQSGALITEYVRSPHHGTLLHLNRDRSGRYSVLVVTRDS